jgi:hypothetical protein
MMTYMCLKIAHLNVRGTITLIDCALFKFTLALWKLLILEFLLGMSETFLCPVSAFQGKIVLLLDALQLLMLFVVTLAYLERKLFFLVIFYNYTSLIIKILIVLKLNFFLTSYVVVFGLIQLLLLSKL